MSRPFQLMMNASILQLGVGTNLLGKIDSINKLPRVALNSEVYSFQSPDESYRERKEAAVYRK